MHVLVNHSDVTCSSRICLESTHRVHNDGLAGMLGYEPADLTVHPPPPQNDQGWVHFFRIGV